MQRVALAKTRYSLVLTEEKLFLFVTLGSNEPLQTGLGRVCKEQARENSATL